MEKYDKFTQAYIACALWSSHDNADDTGGEPLDRNYSPADIHPETLARMVADCAGFQEENRDALDRSGLSLERQGHDYWLTRNRHGAGFWDEWSGWGEEATACRELTDAAHADGSFNFYVGDDGMIHGS
jgi:hypothetical protein